MFVKSKWCFHKKDESVNRLLRSAKTRDEAISILRQIAKVLARVPK